MGCGSVFNVPSMKPVNCRVALWVSERPKPQEKVGLEFGLDNSHLPKADLLTFRFPLFGSVWPWPQQATNYVFLGHWEIKTCFWSLRTPVLSALSRFQIDLKRILTSIALECLRTCTLFARSSSHFVLQCTQPSFGGWIASAIGEVVPIMLTHNVGFKGAAGAPRVSSLGCRGCAEKLPECVCVCVCCFALRCVALRCVALCFQGNLATDGEAQLLGSLSWRHPRCSFNTTFSQDIRCRPQVASS